MVSSTVNTHTDQFPFDPETYSPLSRYTTSALGIEDYVDSNLSDIDSSPDIGTHSSFNSQQAGPDSTYDTLAEANGAPPPTNSEDDIDSATSDVDSSTDVGIEGTFTYAQGSVLDSSYFTIQEESMISAYGGETGSVFVTGSVPDMADRDQLAFYQAIFWNPTDNVYDVSRVEFNYTGSSWLNAIAQGSGSSSPTSEWALSNKQVAYWAGSSPITVQPHTVHSFYVCGDSNKINSEFYIDIRITANSSTYTASYHSEQSNGNRPAAQLWLGSSLPPSQIHSVSTSTQTTVYVSLEEDSNKADILSGGTLTIDVPSSFTGITDVGGTNWGTATINGNQITVSNTATVKDSYITYAFQITSPSDPGLYKLDVAFEDGSYAHPIGNFTIHVTGVPPTVEKINLEYQWTSAAFDRTHEEVCIYTGSHTGSEDLTVNYWDGFSWNALGAISATGWTNLTATGLTSFTYTIQLIGTSESSDSSKDLWNIDLITLHTWTTQTYNYKLDLEVQWTSANSSQDYEELCIYAGSMDTESIRVDVWNGAGWTNIASDLTPSSWNNFTIGTWLTSSVFTIRFRGDIEVGDTTQSSWEIDACLLHTWDNNVPQNTPTPSISNLDDTTYLYAKYRQYQLTANVSDEDGYAEIDFFELTLTSDDRVTEYWTIRYDEDTNSFTEQSDPSDYITLDAGSSSSIESGNSISATFFITINWNHPDVSNTDLKSEVFDATPSSDLDYYEVNWNVETRLDTSSGPTLNDGSGTIDRGDLDESMTASGIITYLGSTLHPAASDIDVWISSSEYGTQVGPWEATNYEDIGGSFSTTVYSDNLVGLDTFTFKAVEEGVGAGGSDLFGSSQSANYISDRVQVQSYSTDDSRINVDSAANMQVTLYYDYDDSFVTDGTVTINGISATYSGSNGVWDFSDTESVVQLNTYDSLTYSGGTHGITVEDQNGQNLNQIWDRITVFSYSVVDNRVDVDTSVNIDVTLVYAYDSSAVTDGTVTVNTISATHQGGGVWRFSDTKATVQGVTYNLVAASGNTHGITLVDQNSQFQGVIWDQITVLSYSTLDNRVNLDDLVTINVTLEYAYDNADVADGVVTINLVLASYQGNGIWQISTSRSTVQGVTYNSVVCSGNTHGIADVDQNGQSQLVIWDQITVRTYSVSDGRTNINGNVDINVTIEYEYDDNPVTTGTATINAFSATHLGGGVWRIIQSRATVQLVTYNVVACSGNSYGITDVNQNSQSTQVIWDQVTVRSYTVVDTRVDVDTAVNIDVLIEFEYDDTAVTDGTVTINSISATHIGTGVWRITDTKSIVQSVIYNTVACSGNTFGITGVNQNGQSQTVIWDQIIVRSYSIVDNRVEINTAVSIDVTLEYEFDDSDVSNGIVTINGISSAYQGSGVWRITQTKLSVQSVTYNTVAVSGNAYGITSVDQNSQSQEVIWDQITVRSYTVIDSRVDLDDSVNIDVLIEYEYDDTPVTDGSVSINGVSATPQGSGTWRIVQFRSSVQGVTYDTVTCSGNSEGITSVNQNGQSQIVIWDQITVRGYEVSDSRDNVGDTITVTIELEYAYDDSDVEDGTVTVNSILFTYTGSLGKWSANRIQAIVTDETFDTVVVSGNSFGITDVNQNGQSQTIIWDRIQVLTTAANDTRLNIGAYCQIQVTLQLEYDSSALGAGDTVTLNGVAMTWDVGDSRFELNRQKLTIGLWTFFVNSSLESTYGISALNINSQEVSVIWDQILILTTVVDDARVSVGANVELRVTAELAYDGHVLGSGDAIVMDSSFMNWDGGNGWFDLTRSQASVGTWTYQVNSAIEATYGISALDLNGQSQQVIWDQLIINIVADMDSVPNGIQVNFTVTVTFQYDSAPCTTYTIRIARNATHWHTFSSANISFFIDTNSAVVYNYTATAVVSETTYGIIVFSTNTETVTWGGGITAPVNDTAPVLANPDNTDFMYARLRYYVITSNVSDAQGYADINYIELSFWDNTRVTEVWRIRYTESTNVFSIELGPAYITLAGSSYIKSGNDIDITWMLKIDWDHLDLSNIDVRQYVVDDSAESDTNWYESDWNVETRLDYSVSPSLSDDRGDLNTNDLVLTGTVVYYGSALNPLGNETDVWVLHDVSGTWSGNVNGVGAFSIGSITSSASVRLNTYSVKVVVDGDGSGGSDLYYTSSATTEFITDRIEFYLSGAVDGRINVNNTCTVWWNARYDYDNVEITNGLTALLNDSKTLLWDSTNIRWYFSESVQSVSRVGYSVLSASESGYGLTDWTQTASDASIIWDFVVVRSYSVTDDRINVGESVDIDVLIEYEYDDSYVDDGTVTINSISASYQGSGIWRISQSRASVLSVTFDSVSCAGNTLNITLVNQNLQSQEVIWDRVLVSGSSVADNHVNVDDSVNIDVTLVFEYDSALVTSGTVTINSVSATHQGSGVWRITQSRSTSQSVTFDTVASSGNTYGITTMNQNGQSQQVIWDQVVVVSYTALDDRVNVDASVSIDALLNYAFDGSPVTDGTVTINSVSAIHQGSGVWRISESRSSVQAVTYNSVSTSGNAEGITSVDQNGQFQQVIWDRIIIQSLIASDTRVNINDVVVINVTIEYEYDSSDVVDGVVLVQSISASYIADGIWQISTSKITVQAITFNTVVCSGNSLGISSVNQNSQQQIVIWDQVVVRSYSVVDTRVNVDDSVNIDATLEYEYDDSAVTDGTVTINGLSATHLGSGIWRTSDSKSSVQSATYDTVVVSGNLYGIDNINQNGQSQTVIWDQITVRSYLVLDSRVDVGDSVDVDVTLEYEYDDTEVSDGTILVNGISATYSGAGVWRITVSEFSVGSNTYNTVVASGNSFSITDVNQNGQSQQVIWDQVVVRSLSASEDRDDVGSTITVYVTLEYEHDDTDVTDGSVILNTVSFTYTGSNGVWSKDRSQSIVTSETFDSVAVSGNAYGISTVDLGGASTTIIWDRIRILTITVDDSRLSTDSTARIMVTAELEYDGHSLGSGDSLFLDDSLMTWDSGNSWFYLDTSQSSVGLWNFYVNASGASESTYGISVVNTMGLSQDVIWDRLLITITPDSTSVIDFTDVSFTLDVTFDFDSSTCTTYVVDVRRNATYWKSFTNANISQFIDNNAATTYQYTIQVVVDEAAYGITAFTSNTVEVSWTTPSNFAPFNNGAPILMNPDDTDNMYARLRLYVIRSSLVDYDGYADIDYVELSLWDNSRLFEVWRVRYTSVTHAFSIEAGVEYIQLSSSSSFLEIGALLNVTWHIKIAWDHFDLQNVDVRQYVVDVSAVSDLDWSESDWDIETRLDYSPLYPPTLSDARGDVDTDDLQASGNVIYYGSLFSPLTNETDIWVIHDFSGSWSGSINAFGALSVSGIGSSSLVRLNTYTFKIVPAGSGPASADLFYTTSPTSTFITDRIEFYVSGADDSRININEMGDVWWSARYQYDSSDIQSGLTAYLNGIKLLSWDSINSRWHYQEARTSPMKIVYQISSATESGFGITNWIDSTTNQTIIWDSLIITITDPFDQRTNVDTNATGITVSAIYGYDSTPFDGTILLDNTTFQFSSVHRQYYTAASAFGDTYGIDVISVNDQTWCIWDQIEVVSIISNVTYMDPNEYARVQVYLLYDFDDAPVQDGNFSLKFEDLVHLADGIWEVNITRLSYQMINFDTLTTCEATIFGITHFDLYGNDLDVYWDRLEIYDSSAADSRIDVGSTGFSRWSVRLENAGIDITSGITALVTGSATMTYVDGFWRASHSSDVVGDQTFTVLSASLEGIDFFITSTSDVTIIWDRIEVQTTSASSTTPIIEEFIIISATLSYEYDGTEVTDGVVTLWDQDSQISMSYNVSGGFWYANITKVETGEYTFYIEAVSGNQYGITQLSLDGNQITVEFVPPPLPRLTPMTIAGISGGVAILIIISAVAIRRRYYIEVPYEIKQINAILDAIEKEEKIEEIDVKTVEQSLLDLLEPGLVELGLTLEEILASVVDADLDAIHVIEPDMEMVEALEEFELPEPEEEEELVREIPKPESTGEFEELDIEAYTDMEAAADEALALMLEEVRRIKEKSGVKVPLSKDDWIEKLPSSVKSMFFEEELRELEIPDIEQLAKLSPEEVEGLLDSISAAQKTDTIDVEESYVDIVNALKIKFNEIEEAEELDEGAQKKRLIRTLPSFVIDYFKEAWLENLCIDELNELTQLTEDELKTVIDSLLEAKEAKEPREEISTEEIDFERELERLDLVEDTIEDADVEDIDDTVVEQPSVEEIEELEVDVEPDDSSAIEEMWKLDFDLEEARKLKEEPSDFEAEEELPEAEDEDRMTD
ncbi:MAG: hypothetical protein AM326_01890 [Candidatus Thorarchaeota archaeon SMTZ-45]|nr:MAG: hypothetical protein AM326_01890 [Candidatus Thorarchaeota archaeon SMTZ-45]